MNKLFLNIAFVFICSFTCYGQTTAQDYPIDTKTSKITYNHHTNSGMAIYTTIQIFQDSLVWDYIEARNDCRLKDICKYDKEEFNKLIKELSKIKFSATDEPNSLCGGAGYSYSFETNSERYLYYDDSSSLSGDYRKVSDLIQQFIWAHKTKCEILFDEYSRMPHERGHFGEFKILPKELQKYKVK